MPGPIILDDSMTVDSVHVDSATGSKSMAKKSKRKAKAVVAGKPARRRGKGLNMKIGSDGSMHIRHMGDDDKCLALLPGIEIQQSDSVTMAEGARKLVWNKLALPGMFKGHPSGPFEMNADHFSQIEKNFKRDGIDVPFDYEHASEIPVGESVSKARGEAVASGWIKDVQARADGLYGLVDWTDAARAKITSQEYKYISPAVRFGARDGVTGESVGAKLTSSALCLKPFLKQLPAALAADSEYTAFLCSEISKEEVVTLAASSGGYAYGPNELLPRFRRMLNLDDLASADDMLSKVERLEELCDMADGDPSATVEGVCLGNYIPPIREFMRLPANTTLSDLLEAFAEMIEDSSGVEMSDIPSVTPQEQTTQIITAPVPNAQDTINIMDANTITLSDHEAKVTTAVAAAVTTEVAKATAPLTLQLTDVKASLESAIASKALSDAKIVELTDQLKKRDADAVTARVDEAFDTYKDTKKLSDDDKAAMPIVLSTNPELFNKLYPRVTADKKHLLSVLSTDTSPRTTTVEAKVVPALNVLLSDTQTKYPTKTYDECFTLALAEQKKLMAG